MVATIQFVHSPYQENKATLNISELRYEIFTIQNVSGDRLPPTLSRKVNHHTFVVSMRASIDQPSPIGNGLQMEGLKLCEEFILNSPVPDAIVELTRYKCKKGCKTNSSSCKRVNLVCTDSCSYINDD